MWHKKKSATKVLYYLLHEEFFEARMMIYWIISSPSKSGTVKLQPLKPVLTEIKFAIQHREPPPTDFASY